MLSLGIVGLPNVGKSTLFNALTKNNVLSANYPFATIEPNVGIVSLPDTRLDELARLYESKKVTPATVTFVDIAGLVRGASQGQGLGNKFLANIRETGAIVQVVRVFVDNNVLHVEGGVDPESDISTINTELILADIQTLNNRLKKLEAEAKRDSKTYEPVLIEAKKALAHLDSGHILYNSPIDTALLADLQLLTAKPFIYVFNLDEHSLANNAVHSDLRNLAAPAPCIFLCAKIEEELIELDQEESRMLLAEYGQKESGLNQLKNVGFATLGLQTYLTAGVKETRAWTVPQGATAPEAAGVIHTDFQKGFIKAEVVSYSDLIKAGSLQNARSTGKARLEGKDYIMQDGDVVEFRFNV